MDPDALQDLVRRQVVAGRRDDAHLDVLGPQRRGEVEEEGARGVAGTARIGMREEQDAHAT